MKKIILVVVALFVFINKNKAQDKYGFIDKTGNMAISATFDDAGDFSEGLAAFKDGNKWGFIDKNGKIIIAAKYASVAQFKNGYCRYFEQNRWGLINTKGEIIIQPIYEMLYDFYKGVTVAKYDGKYQIINSKIETLVDLSKYSEFISFNEGIYQCRIEDVGVGLINSKGDIILPFKWGYGDFRDFKNGLGTIINRDSSFIINTKGNRTYCDKVERIFEFGDGLACFKYKNDSKYGYLNTQGKIIIQPTFDNPSVFNNGRAITKINGKEVMINKQGNVIDIGNSYDTGYFSDGLARYQTLQNDFGFIDTTGKIVIEQKFKNVDFFHEGFAKVRIATGSGYAVNQNNNITTNSTSTKTTANGVQWSSADMSNNTYRLLGVMIVYSDATQTSKAFPHYFDVYGTNMTNENAVFNMCKNKLNSYYTYSKYSWLQNSNVYDLTRGKDLRSYETHEAIKL